MTVGHSCPGIDVVHIKRTQVIGQHIPLPNMLFFYTSLVLLILAKDCTAASQGAAGGQQPAGQQPGGQQPGGQPAAGGGGGNEKCSDGNFVIARKLYCYTPATLFHA